MNKLFVYLPCYNESGNIEPLIELWLNEIQPLQVQGYALQIVPIDDKSTDSTLSILRILESNHSQIRVIAHNQNQNLGGALLTAIKDFLQYGESEDLMCVMDGDNTHKPFFIHSMIDALQCGKDCVIASRYQHGATINGVPKNRLFFSDCARIYYSCVLHVPNVRDYTCGYRIYRYSAIKKGYMKYGESLVSMKTFSCMMELLYKLHRVGCCFTEVPFNLYYEDKVGNSKMDILHTVKDSLIVAIKLRLFSH